MSAFAALPWYLGRLRRALAAAALLGFSCALLAAPTVEWALSTGPYLNVARMGHQSVLLPDGRLLLTGGHGQGFAALDSAEIWTPAADAFGVVPMQHAHDAAAFAVLDDGRFLLAGGAGDFGVAPGSDVAELFDPATGQFSATGSLQFPRMNAAAATLSGGQVLVVGGWYDDASAMFAELYDPQTGAFTLAGALAAPRAHPVVLPASDGRAVVFGGVGPYGSPQLEQVELFDPVTGSFSVLQSSLVPVDPGWLIRGSNFSRPQKLPDGRYLLLAYRPAAGVNEFALLTFDPDTLAFARHPTLPALPDSEVDSLLPPLIDPHNGVAYLIGTSLDDGRMLARLYVVDWSDWSASVADVQYILPPAFFLGQSSAVILQDGRLFITGGHSELGAQTNFSPLDRSLFAAIEAGADACDISINPDRVEVAAAASAGSVTVDTTSPDCAWNASSDSAWLTFSPGNSGTGSGALGFAVAANESQVPRMGTITVGSENLVVLQAGYAPVETMSGTAADDLLAITLQDQQVDGLGGIDTLVLPSFPNGYTVTQTGPGQFTLTFLDYTLSLSNVEYLRFGTSTQTTLAVADLVSGELQDQITKLTDLYLAFFGRAPDVSGLEYWVHQLLAAGRGFSLISKDFAWSVEAQALFPKTGSNRDFVRTVYQNVFDRDPDPGGWDYWTARLDALGETDLNDRGAFVGELLLGAYAPTSGAADRDLLGHRHDIALDYVSRLSMQPGEGFDPAINDLLVRVNLGEETVAGATQVLDYVFDTTMGLGDILDDPEMLASVWEEDSYIDWEADANWLPATVILPQVSPLRMSEVEVSVLFNDYSPDANGQLNLPVPDTPYSDAFVLLPMPGSEDYVVYLFATILPGEQSVEFSIEATAVNLLLNGINRELLSGSLSPAAVRQVIREHSAGYISAFTTALRADPFYLRPDKLDTVYGPDFAAAVEASSAALQAEQAQTLIPQYLQPRSDSPTDSEGLKVLPEKERYDFAVFPARGGLLGYGNMSGELLIQNDSMLPARYMTTEHLSGQVLHLPAGAIFGDIIGPQWSVIFGFNASSTVTQGTDFQSSKLILFTPGYAAFSTDVVWLQVFQQNQTGFLRTRLLVDNVITVMSSLIPVSDQSFYRSWYQWIGSQGWFQTAADKLYVDRDITGAIKSFAAGMATPGNLKATLKFATKWFAKQVGGSKEGAKLLLKSKAKWLFKAASWKGQVMIYAADLASTAADLASTPPVIQFDEVGFPLSVSSFTPGISKVGNENDPRRITISGRGLGRFDAGPVYEPRLALQARDTDGQIQSHNVVSSDIHTINSDSIGVDLPFSWLQIGSDIVGPIHFQVTHSFVDPYTGGVVSDVSIPRNLPNAHYKIALGSEILLTGTTPEQVNREQTVVVLGSGFAFAEDDNALFFTDRLGSRRRATVTTATDTYLEAVVPPDLEIGPLIVHVELKDGTRSNDLELPMIPRSVEALPEDDTDFELQQLVSLSQLNGVPIFYAIDDGAEQPYAGPILLDRTSTIYARAVETVGNEEYASLPGSFFYYKCAENEILEDGECFDPDARPPVTFNAPNSWTRVYRELASTIPEETVNFSVNLSGRVDNGYNPLVAYEQSSDGSGTLEITNVKYGNPLLTISGTFNVSASKLSVTTENYRFKSNISFSNFRLSAYRETESGWDYVDYPDWNFSWQVTTDDWYDSRYYYVRYDVTTESYEREDEDHPFEYKGTNTYSQKLFTLKINHFRSPNWEIIEP